MFICTVIDIIRVFCVFAIHTCFLCVLFVFLFSQIDQFNVALFVPIPLIMAIENRLWLLPMAIERASRSFLSFDDFYFVAPLFNWLLLVAVERTGNRIPEADDFYTAACL